MCVQFSLILHLQAFPAISKTDDTSQQIGQRLASPTSSCVSSTTSDSIYSKTSSKNITDESPIAAISQASSFSTSLCERSTLSTFDDDRRSLNDGFIAGMEDKEVDISRIMSEPVISGAFEQGEYVRLGDVCPRETLSDTMIFDHSMLETPLRHNRSNSLEDTLNGSGRKSSLRRGQPNSLKAGLLQGDEKEVQKLRRSFGLDKSDISLPVPINMQHMIDEGQYVHLDNSFNDYLDTHDQEPLAETIAATHDVKKLEQNTDDKSVGFTKEQTDLQESLEDGNSPENVAAKSDESGKADIELTEASCVELGDQKTLAQQKQESKDSLLSQTSSIISPVTYIKEREMTRSISADSGKGSMCEEPMDITDAAIESLTNSVFDQKESTSQTQETSSVDLCATSDNTNFETSNLTKNGSHSKKSASTQDLVREVETPTPTRVSRSKSLLEGGFRKNKIKPNLQISAETHKLLARAGYISEKKAEKPNEEFEDFAVPCNLKFPVIKQAETVNPRRESIIALQKNNAGHVKNNILQFNKICETKTAEDKFTSPLRFSNSTTRRKGISPLRIVKKDCSTESFKQVINASLDTSFGTAKVPISTQMIKPSDPTTLKTQEENMNSTGLKRKPSIYYAGKDSVSKLRNLKAGIESPNTTIMEEDESKSSITEDENPQIFDTETLNETVFISDDEEKKRLFDGKSIEHNRSLQETIINVCTPRSEKLKQALEKADCGNKENKEKTAQGKSLHKMPEIKPSILTTPLTLEKISLRTASNKTPLEVFKTSKSPRSPVKPLKRLGSSPHSPRSRSIRSPKLVKNRRSLLSSMPNQNDDLNNL